MRPPLIAIHAGQRWDAAGWHQATLTYGAQLPAYDPQRYPAGDVVAESDTEPQPTAEQRLAARPGRAATLGLYCAQWP